MAGIKEKFINVTFNVSESLIAEIDDFCKERGGVKRKQWLYDLMENNEQLKKEIEQKQKLYSDLFTSTLKYRTFYRRLKNLFSKF
jgi:phage-related protein